MGCGRLCQSGTSCAARLRPPRFSFRYPIRRRGHAPATAIFSFAPYIGPVVIVTLLTMASLVSTASLAAALALPAVYVSVLLFVQNLISPYIWGRRLSLNPVAIFIAIVLWGWMWGMAGALLAVPLLASFKIVAERFRTLRPAAEFLSS